MTTEHVEYWKLPSDKLRQYIIDNWDDDECMDLGDAIHCFYEKTRPRDWTDVKHDALDLWEKMFKEEVDNESPLSSVLSGVCAASAAGVWDTVAEAFGLKTRYVELVLAVWYERHLNKEEAPPAITWDDFMRLYNAEVTARESNK